MNDNERLDRFIDAYIEAIEFTDTDNPDFDEYENTAGYSDEFLAICQSDCQKFLAIVGDRLPDNLLPQAGHDFWLTRNGHGTGFWDRPEVYGDELSEYLTSLCGWGNTFDEKCPYVGDDNLIYIG